MCRDFTDLLGSVLVAVFLCLHFIPLPSLSRSVCVCAADDQSKSQTLKSRPDSMCSLHHALTAALRIQPVTSHVV